MFDGIFVKFLPFILFQLKQSEEQRIVVFVSVLNLKITTKNNNYFVRMN